jgi:hypothetical protein
MRPIIYILTIVFFVACGQNNRNSTEKLVDLQDSLNLISDTLLTDNYLLVFESTDGFERTDIYGDLDYRNRLTDTIHGNYINKAEAIQTYLKKRFGNYFYLTDSTLVLKLANGDTMNFHIYVDKIDRENFEFVGYIFEHYFDKIDYYLLFIEYYEGCNWMLVNRKNGFKKLIHGLPYISKDRKKIIAIGSDLDAGYSFNGIELYTVLADSLRTEFSKETDWGPIDVKWINENEFLLKREHFSIDDKIFDYKRVKIINRKEDIE